MAGAKDPSQTLVISEKKKIQDESDSTGKESESDD